MKDIQTHPAAEEFPLLDADRLQQLADDILANGLREPIRLFDGQVIDGRNRLAACNIAGVDPTFENMDIGTDPYALVWSLNGERRDLPAAQRLAIWDSCVDKSEAWQTEQQRIKDEANAKRGEAATKQHETSNPRAGEKSGSRTDSPTTKPKVNKTRKAKAEASGTDAGTVKRMETLKKNRRDLWERVRLGEITVTEASRQRRRDEVSENVADLPQDKYTVIYADPPWDYNDKQAGSISDSYGAAEKHYPSMSATELASLGVPELAADNSVLFLWTTSPLLPEGLALAKAWGFKYKASFVWDKIKHNMGHYNSVRHEYLLICTKGSCTPHHVKLFDSVQSIERTKHSAKPEEFREIIDTLYPSVKKLELFRRGDSTEGWDSWGNEHV